MPLKDLHIALIALDIVADDKRANVGRIKKIISTLDPSTDLVVLPELCFTGFKRDAEMMKQLAETNDGECICAIETIGHLYNVAVAGSFVAKDTPESDKIYNRAFIVTPDGDKVFYDKRHLFTMGGERLIFSPGCDDKPIIEYRSWSLSLSVCYDLRFPVWCRNRNLAYDAMIVPSNWPESRSFPWQQLLSARAIENQAYYLGCDRSGEDIYGTYSLTDTIVVNDWGRIIATAGADGVATATLSADDLNRHRKSFTPHLDADNFTVDLATGV